MQKINLSSIKKSYIFIIVIILLAALVTQLGFFKTKFYDILNLKKSVEKVDDQKNNKSLIYSGFSAAATQSFTDFTLLSSNDLEEFLYKVLKPLREIGLSQIQQSDIDSFASRKEVRSRAEKISRQVLSALQYDYDKNLQITKQELDLGRSYKEKESRGSNFILQMEDQQIEQTKALDLNKDNIIDQSELLQVQESEKRKDKAAESLESILKLDPNNDKILTVAELKEVAIKIFKSADLNQDDVLSKEEKEAFATAIEEKSKAEEASKVKELSNVGAAEHPQVTAEAVSKEVGASKAKEALNSDIDTELHVIGVYESKLKTGVGGAVSVGAVNINVDRPNKKVILLVTSYNAIKWNIKATKGTEIKNVILYSYEKNSEILLNGKNFQASDFKIESMAYKANGPEFIKLKNEVRKKIGLEISSFSGAYAAGEEPFLINSISNDPTLKTDYLKTSYPNGDLPKITLLTTIKGVKGRYDLKGNLVKELSTVPDDAFYLEKQKQYYKITDTGVTKHDEAGNLLEDLKLGLEVPRFSWPKGVIYDEANNRIVVLTSHVDSYLYFCDLKSKKWKAISLGVAKSFSDISYDKDSKAYVLATEASTTGIRLSWFNNKGQLTTEELIPLESFVGLSDIYDPNNGPGPEIRAFIEKDYIAITARNSNIFESRKSGIERIYLYDRKSKKVYLTWFTKA